MREDLIGRSRRAAVKREKELRLRFLGSEDGAKHDDRAGLSLQAHMVSGNDEEKDWTAESCEAEERSNSGTRQKFFSSSVSVSLELEFKRGVLSRNSSGCRDTCARTTTPPISSI